MQERRTKLEEMEVEYSERFKVEDHKVKLLFVRLMVILAILTVLSLITINACHARERKCCEKNYNTNRHSRCYDSSRSTNRFPRYTSHRIYQRSYYSRHYRNRYRKYYRQRRRTCYPVVRPWSSKMNCETSCWEYTNSRKRFGNCGWK